MCTCFNNSERQQQSFQYFITLLFKGDLYRKFVALGTKIRNPHAAKTQSNVGRDGQKIHCLNTASLCLTGLIAEALLVVSHQCNVSEGF